VKINHAQTGWDAVPTRLAENLKGRSDKSVLVAADAGVTFADVARVMDACGAAGAKVVLSSPTL
jgi:biopolymer transport protein ExbD